MPDYDELDERVVARDLDTGRVGALECHSCDVRAREGWPLTKQSARYTDAMVVHRIYGNQPVSARLLGPVLFSDQSYWRHAGQRRYFWLPEQGVQLVYEPFGWRDAWYVDFVSVDLRTDGETPVYVVTDCYVDVVVEGMGPTYRILDLDELAAALATGATDSSTARRTLVETQQFLESYLHRCAAFPPLPIQAVFSADHQYPDWAEEPVALQAEAPRR